MQMLRTRLGFDEEVVGCSTCGVVQHLIDGEVHHCGDMGNAPRAVTIDTGKLNSPSVALDPIPER